MQIVLLREARQHHFIIPVAVSPGAVYMANQSAWGTIVGMLDTGMRFHSIHSCLVFPSHSDTTALSSALDSALSACKYPPQFRATKIQTGGEAKQERNPNELLPLGTIFLPLLFTNNSRSSVYPKLNWNLFQLFRRKQPFF
jgi:hypothetical protein